MQAEIRNKNFWIVTEHLVVGIICSFLLFYKMYKVWLEWSFINQQFWTFVNMWIILTLSMLLLWGINIWFVGFRWYENERLKKDTLKEIQETENERNKVILNTFNYKMEAIADKIINKLKK
jgi:hypothetical protein